MKFVYPILLVFPFGLGCILSIFNSEVPPIKWIFPIFLVIFILLYMLIFRKIKRIGHDENSIYISNYRNIIGVPYDQIEDVEFYF